MKLNTFILGFISSFRIKSLQQDSDVFIQLIPISIDNIEHSIILSLALFQLLYSLPKFRFGPLPLF